MPATFSLDATDYNLLERAVIARFARSHGRLNATFFAQVLAWMFMSLAIFSFLRLSENQFGLQRAFGWILSFAAIGFLFSVVRPTIGQWLYKRYVLNASAAFFAQQSVAIEAGSLVLQSASGKSIIPQSAIIDQSQDERNHYLFITGTHAVVIPEVSAAALGTDFAAYLAACRGEA
ncbi:hypothetical protein [Piscinibacter gummiphilus]|uniref:YcxB-like protein domain-containing protein n=1 Tax=Piscinibacter gummiphilus TaxID=946333 RepID=A0ABZ0CPL0_9BURK|nr:hypothetical protein [Piscinibacter gummiphilus]WOB06931.1 hypothetical protein RXV79_18635 [Piscinibacter gummiphilus]